MSVAAPITLKIITCFALKKFVENRRPWPLLLRISLPTSKFLLRDDVQRYVAIASLGCRVPSGNAGVSSLRSPCRFLEVTCSSNPFFGFICRNFKVLACADLSSFCRCVRKISSKKNSPGAVLASFFVVAGNGWWIFSLQFGDEIPAIVPSFCFPFFAGLSLRHIPEFLFRTLFRSLMWKFSSPATFLFHKKTCRILKKSPISPQIITARQIYALSRPAWSREKKTTTKTIFLLFCCSAHLTVCVV